MTFRESNWLDGANGDAAVDHRTPLLERRGSRHGTRQNGSGSWKQRVEGVESLMKQAWSFANSRTGRGVFKCSVAYFLGSLATFVPFIAALLGQQDGKHLVATITVYFHPARSRGSMFEAIICATLAFVYTVIICFTSMGVCILFGRSFHLIVVGQVIVLLVFCGGGLGFVGWVKQRLENPLVNIACSLTSLAIITVLTKEGAVQAGLFSDDKITQVMLMIIFGVIISTAVSFLISPVSARQDLQENMIQVTDSFAEMLAMITRGFLTGSEEELLQEQFLHASALHKTVITSLTKNLREAKFEHYVMGTENEYGLEAQMVKCMQRLAQNIGGLRSAATTQFLLLAQSTKDGASTPMSLAFSPQQLRTSFSFMSDIVTSPSENYNVLAAIDEAPDQEESTPHSPKGRRQELSNDSYLPTVNNPPDIFSRFIAQLGPSMVSNSDLLGCLICD